MKHSWNSLVAYDETKMMTCYETVAAKLPCRHVGTLVYLSRFQSLQVPSQPFSAEKMIELLLKHILWFCTKKNIGMYHCIPDCGCFNIKNQVTIEMFIKGCK